MSWGWPTHTEDEIARIKACYTEVDQPLGCPLCIARSEALAPQPATTTDAKLPPVTDDEAHEILSRFVASHFRKDDRECARFRIPADSAHDDDLRMAQYIEETRALRSRVVSPEVEAAAEAARDLLYAVRSAHRGSIGCEGNVYLPQIGVKWLEPLAQKIEALGALSSARGARGER